MTALFDRVEGLRIEGLAIISADGMIADAHGVQPEQLRLEADQRLFYESLDQAAAVAHGRHSGEGGPGAARRRRLILTRRIAGMGRDPDNDMAVLWNPAGAPLAQAWRALGEPIGTLAVIGGTDVFGLFLELGYDAFHLSRVAGIDLPGGRPVFPGVPTQSPEALLADRGLKPGPERILDTTEALSLVSWHNLSTESYRQPQR
jgi:dihydrofolate reductase